LNDQKSLHGTGLDPRRDFGFLAVRLERSSEPNGSRANSMVDIHSVVFFCRIAILLGSKIENFNVV
jgi:hypothetical protein